MYYQDIYACCKTYQGGGSAALPPLLSGSEVWGFDGSKKMYEIRALEVNMAADTTGEFMTLWDWVPAMIQSAGDPNNEGPRRLYGPWPLDKFLMGSASDGSGRTWAFNLKSGWNTLVPTVANVSTASRPSYPFQHPKAAPPIVPRAANRPYCRNHPAPQQPPPVGIPLLAAAGMVTSAAAKAAKAGGGGGT